MSKSENQRTLIMYARIPSKSSTSPKRRSNFARDMARDAFGSLGHRFDDQWADHVDAQPNDIAEKRGLAIWGGAP